MIDSNEVRGYSNLKRGRKHFCWGGGKLEKRRRELEAPLGPDTTFTFNILCIFLKLLVWFAYMYDFYSLYMCVMCVFVCYSLVCIYLKVLNFFGIIRETCFCFQAISLKESQLIGNVTMNIEDTIEDDSSPVRIVAPKKEVLKDFTKDDSEPNMMKSSDILDDKETGNLQGSLKTGSWNENNIPRSVSEISSYEDFMEHIDQKLQEIEAELVTVLNVSTLVLDSTERPKNSRLQQTMELLESIHGIRQRYNISIYQSIIIKNVHIKRGKKLM